MRALLVRSAIFPIRLHCVGKGWQKLYLQPFDNVIKFEQVVIHRFLASAFSFVSRLGEVLYGYEEGMAGENFCPNLLATVLRW